MLETSSSESLCGLNVPDDLAVDSAGDAVLELQVHLGDSVLGEDGGIGDITCVLLVLNALKSPFRYLSCSAQRQSDRETYGWRRTRPCCGW